MIISYDPNFGSVMYGINVILVKSTRIQDGNQLQHH
jgi:hypothetical protein